MEMYDELEKDKIKEAIMERSRNVHHYRQFKARVENKIKEMNAKIPILREKLRILFLEERKENFFETIVKANEKNDLKLQRIKTKIEENKKRLDIEREKYVFEKRLQQILEGTDEIRHLKQHRNLLETKRCQLLQIEEKKSEQETENEINRLWHDLAMKNYQAKTAEEENKALERKLRNRADFEILNKQIEERRFRSEELNKLMVEEDKKQYERLLEEISQEKLAQMEAKKRRKAELLKSFHDQFDGKLQRKHQNETIENQILIAERPQESKEQQRREIELYLNYRKQIAEAKRKDDEAYTRMTEQDRLRLQARSDENRKAIHEYRKQMIQSLKRERDEIIQNRKIKEAEEKQKEEEYTKLLKEKLEFNRKLDEEKKAMWFLEQKQLADELKKQESCRRLQEQREKQEWNCLRKERMEEEKEKYKKDLLEALHKGMLPLNLTCQHPFERVLKQ